MDPTTGFEHAGVVGYRDLDVPAGPLPQGRDRHQYGSGPFAKLVMPPLPNEAGVYLWTCDEDVLYIGQTRTPLKQRLGPNGYATISTYNTLASEPGRTNGGQQTNCRINALANEALGAGKSLHIWYRITRQGLAAEAQWMASFGLPPWNRRLERRRLTHL